MNSIYVYLLVSVTCGLRRVESVHSTMFLANAALIKESEFRQFTRYYVKKYEVDNVNIDIYPEDE